MNNFAVLTINYTYTTTSVIIQITTNNPVHLTCYYTDKQPGRHKTERTDRGLTLPWGAYFCFVAWKTVEQQEPGDTLIHTFEIPGWIICQTKWFAFRGTVSGQLSPSVSPIFKHHHSSREFTATFSPDAHPETSSVDGRVQHRQLAPELAWPQLRNSPGNTADDTVVTNMVNISASAWTVDKWWTLTRSIEVFDTSSLGAYAVPISGYISIRGHSKHDGLNISPTLALLSSNPLFNTLLIPDDFTSLGITKLAPSMPYADFDPDGRNTFPLNLLGLLAINPTGRTRFGFREFTYDVLGNIPNFIMAEYSRFEWRSADSGVPDKPELTITYALP